MNLSAYVSFEEEMLWFLPLSKPFQESVFLGLLALTRDTLLCNHNRKQILGDDKDSDSENQTMLYLEWKIEVRFS